MPTNTQRSAGSFVANFAQQRQVQKQQQAEAALKARKDEYQNLKGTLALLEKYHPNDPRIISIADTLIDLGGIPGQGKPQAPLPQGPPAQTPQPEEFIPRSAAPARISQKEFKSGFKEFQARQRTAGIAEAQHKGRTRVAAQQKVEAEQKARRDKEDAFAGVRLTSIERSDIRKYKSLVNARIRMLYPNKTAAQARLDKFNITIGEPLFTFREDVHGPILLALIDKLNLPTSRIPVSQLELADLKLGGLKQISPPGGQIQTPAQPNILKGPTPSGASLDTLEQVSRPAALPDPSGLSEGQTGTDPAAGISWIIRNGQWEVNR